MNCLSAPSLLADLDGVCSQESGIDPYGVLISCSPF